MNVIKLLPVYNRPIRVGDIVKHLDVPCVVTSVYVNDTLDGEGIYLSGPLLAGVAFDRVQLYKYYVVDGSNIKGELAYSEYSKVKPGMKAGTNYISRPILTKLEEGDAVEVFKFKLSQLSTIVRIGTIKTITKDKIVIQIGDILMSSKRHCVRLIYKNNYKNIITLGVRHEEVTTVN